MADRVAAYGAPEAGALAFTRGQRGVDLFLVVSGPIAMIDSDGHGARRRHVGEVRWWCMRICTWRQYQESKAFFSEEKKQKTFVPTVAKVLPAHA